MMEMSEATEMDINPPVGYDSGVAVDARMVYLNRLLFIFRRQRIFK